ncbi:hypothetical protein CR513_15984, partial [Mucuna pruriens]
MTYDQELFKIGNGEYISIKGKRTFAIRAIQEENDDIGEEPCLDIYQRCNVDIMKPIKIKEAKD